MLKSPWKYDTANEVSVSLGPAGGGIGTLYFTNPSSGEAFNVEYAYGSFGASKGTTLNLAKSMKSTPSGGITHVYQRPFHSFGPGDFACGGQLLVIGVTAGIVARPLLPNSGASLVVAVFGLMPFAVLPFWGLFDSLLPSAGASVAACRFGAPGTSRDFEI